MIARATQTLDHHATYGRKSPEQALYERVLEKGRRGLLWSTFAGRSRQLSSLEEVTRAYTVQARNDAGPCLVAIDRICGSEGRAADFDCDFNPLQDHTRERWLGIASALGRGRYLPPVALIQVRDRYFVRDGHHRISAAKALGYKTIEATLEVWQVKA